MANAYWKNLVIWVLEADLAVWGINVLIFGVFLLLGNSWSALFLSGFFSKVSLLETGVLFLIGGVIAFSGSVLPSKTKEHLFKMEDERWSIEKLRRSERKANKYIILAAVLLIEAVAISFLGL